MDKKIQLTIKFHEMTQKSSSHHKSMCIICLLFSITESSSLQKVTMTAVGFYVLYTFSLIYSLCCF